FPTLWSTNGDPKYLDALVRRGTTPLAFELKVATGGQGRYYRRSLLQAVLYRHFIADTEALDPWFMAAGLERTAVEACVGAPFPRPRVSLNRPGSAWVFSQTGSTRWTWRQIWNHLAASGDADEAATIIGAVAGLGTREPNAGPGFAEMAAAFLDAVGSP